MEDGRLTRGHGTVVLALRSGSDAAIASVRATLGTPSTAIRRAMGITLIELAAEDWRKLLQSGRESTSHALGRAAAVTGASGLLVRSAAVPLGVNVDRWG
jgi:hypothetical protein